MGKDNIIRIFLVDDDPGWLKSLSLFLNSQPGFLVCGAASGREEAVELSKKLNFDVILMDINLSGNKYDGIYATLEICSFKRTKVIMVTSLDEEKIVTNSFIAGAVNLIYKLDFDKIPDAIRAAVKNNTPFELLLKDYVKLNKEKNLAILTLAEREIVSYLEQGFTPSQLAAKLNKAEGTIKNQINSILKKLKVKNCKEVVEKVKKIGLQL